MEKWQVVVLISQTIILLGALLAALYFGFKQQEVNDKLANIEKYNYKQTLLNEQINELTAKKELRNITIEIIEMFLWSNQQEKELIENRSREERLKLIRKMTELLYEGLDNKLLVENKQALSNWLKAINYLEMYSHFSGNEIIAGTIVDKTGRREDKDANRKFDKTMIADMGRALSMVSEVHSSLGLSLTVMSNELSEQLKNDNQNQDKLPNKANSADAKSRAAD